MNQPTCASILSYAPTGCPSHLPSAAGDVDLYFNTGARHHRFHAFALLDGNQLTSVEFSRCRTHCKHSEERLNAVVKSYQSYDKKLARQYPFAYGFFAHAEADTPSPKDAYLDDHQFSLELIDAETTIDYYCCSVPVALEHGRRGYRHYHSLHLVFHEKGKEYAYSLFDASLCRDAIQRYNQCVKGTRRSPKCADDGSLPQHFCPETYALQH